MVPLLKIQSLRMKTITLLLLSSFIYITSFGQGRVVINEFMAWPSCTATSEFIELMNFGPGPVDLGCYIVTNGQFSVTIPPNTIINQGEYFVLSGQDVLPVSCGNSDSSVTVDLNWNTCSCTNTAIPTTGDGFLADGGTANEKVVLLDGELNVIDAVSRNSVPSSSIQITTSGVSGGCTPKTFDLDNMTVAYESINISTGRNNSFSRKVDGDCGWVKTTSISANAPNKTGSSSSATYFFTTLTASECDGTHGSISISVSADNISSLFPMNYLLAFDADSNGVFDESDVYRSGIDDSSPDININALAYGRYRITVSSAMGCNLKTFDFFIFNCYGILLNTDLLSWDIRQQGNKYNTTWNITNVEYLEKVVLEASADGILFEPIKSFTPPQSSTSNWLAEYLIPIAQNNLTTYRLKIYQLNGDNYISRSVHLPNIISKKEKLWPNPAKEKLQVSYFADKSGLVDYKIYSLNSRLMAKGKLKIQLGDNTIVIPVNHLTPGNYQILIGEDDEIPIRLSFFKQ